MDESITVRELIERQVREELAMLNDDLKTLAKKRKELLSGVGSAAGLFFLAHRPDIPNPVNVPDAIAHAMNAFQQGAFTILVDGQRMTSLEQRISCDLSARIQFVRLGGLESG